MGLEPLTMGTETITGTHPSNFSIVTDQCAGATIPSGGTCAIGVRFTPGAIGQRFARLSVDNPLFDHPETAPLSGLGGTTPSLSLDEEDIRWGTCRGKYVTVHGTNFPPPVEGTSQGYHQIFVDGLPAENPVMTRADGSFDDGIPIPGEISGTTHVMTAADLALPSYTAGVGFRTPDRDLPVILIPGASGTYMDAGSWQIYSAPPDPELALPIPDVRQLIPMDLGLWPGKHIWLDGPSVAAVLLGGYRVFDPLQLNPDGLTPKPDMFGTIPDVRVGEILWDVTAGPIHADFYLELRNFLLGLPVPGGGDTIYHDEPKMGRNLYYFPYDWRKDISLTGPQLAAMVDEALRTSRKDKVVILAHSMGGLVARNYLLTYGASKVDQLITIATPFLEEPIMAKVVEIGDDWGFGKHLGDIGYGLHPKEAKKLAQNMTTVYQLMPSQYYFAANPLDPGFDPRYLERSYTHNLEVVVEKLDYVASQAFIASRHNAALSKQGETFQKKGISDLSIISGQIYHQRIIGTGVPTINKIVMSPRAVCTDVPWIGTVCLPLPEFGLAVLGTSGDNTVPLHSTLGYRAPNDDRNYFIPNATHGGLTSDERVKLLLEPMLKGARCSGSYLGGPTLASTPGQAAISADPGADPDHRRRGRSDGLGYADRL